MAEPFFNPHTIAVIGATEDPSKFGNAVTINLLNVHDLKAKVIPVSKTAYAIYGLQAYSTITEIPEKIDLAIILVPAKAVPSIVDECIEKKVPSIIIVTAGFGEINEEGRKIEQLMEQKCKASNIRVIGPNCVGIQNTDIDMNASFIQTPIQGEVGIISQSGSFGSAIIDGMRWNDVGVSKFANIGNAMDISFDEILTYYNKDPQTKAIAIYLENITDGHGRAFYNELREISPNKPVVVIKGGRTDAGMAAARSHTGSLASNYRILKTAIEQAGGVVCERIDDYITAIKTFTMLPLPRGDKIGVLTNSGGTGVLFSDNADEFGLKLSPFSPWLIEKITPHVIPLVQKINPLDMIAGANEETYYQITKAMLEEESGIDIVVGCGVNPPFLGMKFEDHFRGMVRAWDETGRVKPLIPLIVFGDGYKEISDYAHQSKTPFFSTPYDAAYAVKLLIDRYRFLSRLLD
jgi:acyl-CoA synthetase (NDP forming)